MGSSSDGAQRYDDGVEGVRKMDTGYRSVCWLESRDALDEVGDEEPNMPLDDYRQKTQFAFEQLFSALIHYKELAKESIPPAFGASANGEDEWREAHEAWEEENLQEIESALAKQREYLTLTDSQAAIAGAILQLAFMGIRQFSNCNARPAGVPEGIPHAAAITPYYGGRDVFGLPIGLIIYAGRNQHHHMDEELRSPSKEIVRHLAEYKVRLYRPDEEPPPYIDPAFDLDVFESRSIAHNVLSILKWNSVDEVFADLEGATNC